MIRFQNETSNSSNFFILLFRQIFLVEFLHDFITRINEYSTELAIGPQFALIFPIFVERRIVNNVFFNKYHSSLAIFCSIEAIIVRLNKKLFEVYV